MPIEFEHEAQLAGRSVKVTADNVPDLLRAIAGLEELNRDARYLHKRIKREDGDAPRIALAFRKDADENEYYGFEEVRGDGQMPRNVTFGKKRDQTAIVPFFPKGKDGYYDPQKQGSRSGGGGGQQNRQPRQPGEPPQKNRQRQPPRGAGGQKQTGGRGHQNRPNRQQAQPNQQQINRRHNEAAKQQGDDLPF